MTLMEPCCVTAHEDAVLRDYTRDDAAVIAAIYNQSIRNGGSTMDTVEKTEADILAQINGFNERETILILEQQGEVLGWGVIKRYSDRFGYRFTCETAVYVDRAYLRKGYGTKLKEALITRCRQLGYHHMVAKIFASNLASIHYNQKLGYEIVGTQKQVGFAAGAWQDVVIMQLLLDNTEAGNS